MNSFDETLPDSPLTTEQRAIVDSLDGKFLEKVDEILLFHAKKTDAAALYLIKLKGSQFYNE